jgi:hypothetical protein
MMKLIAIDDWQKYLWMWKGWSAPDAQGRQNPCDVNPLPAGAVVKSRFDFVTHYHPWSNAENAVVGNEAFLAFLKASGIRYHSYKDPYDDELDLGDIAPASSQL